MIYVIIVAVLFFVIDWLVVMVTNPKYWKGGKKDEFGSVRIGSDRKNEK